MGVTVTSLSIYREPVSCDRPYPISVLELDHSCPRCGTRDRSLLDLGETSVVDHFFGARCECGWSFGFGGAGLSENFDYSVAA